MELFQQLYVGLIMFYHKKKGHRTSGLLLTFWLALFVGSIPELRWEVINYNTSHFENEITWAGFRYIIYVVYFSLVCVILFLNFFAEKPPRYSTYPKAENPSPELSASVMNRLFFAFLDSTTLKGWRRPLTEDDIFDINPEFASREQVPVFDKNFQKTIDKRKRFVTKLQKRFLSTH